MSFILASAVSLVLELCVYATCWRITLQTTLVINIEGFSYGLLPSDFDGRYSYMLNCNYAWDS